MHADLSTGNRGRARFIALFADVLVDVFAALMIA